ncbi:hypothetical protein RJ641_009300 [Dillenia turbinata]|uniref:Uncharacterized protein n=1 Tax=Dillenia turbinata TaxID=194707 RepID=A0AAN8Z3D7_9MAGN
MTLRFPNTKRNHQINKQTMEESIKDQSSASGNAGKSMLRYPLRSATKSKEAKPSPAEITTSSASKRGRPESGVSKSVGVLDLSGKENNAKPPRRLSIPPKSSASPHPKGGSNITPISETRSKRSIVSQGKSDTPVSDISKSSAWRRFSVLSSASYWLSQIKLSESAAKHSISLGFFKLALEAGCEPLQRLQDELKSYVQRHNLTELGEAVKELFECYRISENPEKLQASDASSHVVEEGMRSSDDGERSSSSIGGIGKLKPKSLDTDAVQVSAVTEPVKEMYQNRTPASRVRGSMNKSSPNAKAGSDAGSRNMQRKSQRLNKQEFNKEKEKTKKATKKSATEEGSIDVMPSEGVLQENKENLVSHFSTLVLFIFLLGKPHNGVTLPTQKSPQPWYHLN